jgi:hypothetical protein
VFPVNGSRPVAPPIPRSGPGESGSPRSSVLWRRYDFPPAHSRSLIWFASGHHTFPPMFVLAFTALPCRWRTGTGPGTCSAGCPSAGSLSCGHERDLSGSQAIRPVPLPRSKTPAEPTIPRHWRSRRCCPRSNDSEGFSMRSISRLLRGFSTCCLRFKNGVAATPARLASGWLAGLCREGVEPSGSR